MADISKIRIPSTTAEYTEYNVKDTVSGYVTSSELGTAATQNYTTSITSGSIDLVTSGAVYTAIASLPEPMIFKGTLGTGGTITSLPAASSSNEGFTYKVITAGTYASQTAEVGDLFISNGSAWILVPSGDETSADTWRAIKINGVEQLGNSITTGSVDFINGTNTTVSYDSTNKTVAVSATDSKVRQVGGVVTNSTFPVLLAGSADSETTETASINKSSGIWFNPYRQAFISGFSASATGSSSAAIGINATAVGTSSQAFGNGTRASGNAAHATGIITVASGDYSQAAGHATTANHKAQHVFGEYNVADTSTAAATSRGNYVEIVGNGTGDSARSNARTLDWSGNETIAGQLTDKWGIQSIRTIAESDYQQLSPEEKNNGTIYCRTGADVAASLDHKVTQNPSTSNINYEVLLSTSASSTAENGEINKSENLTYNPSISQLKLSNSYTGNILANLTVDPKYLTLQQYVNNVSIGYLQLNYNDIYNDNKWGGINTSLTTSISTIKQSLSNLGGDGYTAPPSGSYATNVSYGSGGYCRVGKIIIINLRIALSQNISANTALVSNLPVPNASANIVSVMNNRKADITIGTSGQIATADGLNAGNVILSCVYLTS